jgi:hypothetical protein
LQFINAENKLEQNFQISLSIRISREAYIFLCDGDKVQESNCYWFLLMGFGGTKTELRKCPRGTIPDRRNIAAHKSCETPIQTIMVSTGKLYGFIINDCLIAVFVGDVVECAASFIT